MTSLPIIDISYFTEKYETAILPNEELYKDPNIHIIVKELRSAFNEWGFLYLSGHGFSEKIVDQLFDASRKFFEQPQDRKDEVVMKGLKESMIGYIPLNTECFNQARPFDIKETFDYLPSISSDVVAKLPKDFASILSDFYSRCTKLTMSILLLVNMILGIEDREFLLKAHKKFLTENVTKLRSLYYPSVKHGCIQDKQLRCGEHSDYGTITLLFQDESGGLEVQSPSGDFIPATPIPGTIVVNAGDLLERWTSGKIKSTRHRVQFPPDPEKARQSIAFFCHPDNDVVIKCLDGSNRYEPVNSMKYLENELASTDLKS